MSESRARELGLSLAPVFAQWRWWVVIASIMGYGPVPASKLALKKAGLSASDIDVFEEMNRKRLRTDHLHARGIWD